MTILFLLAPQSSKKTSIQRFLANWAPDSQGPTVRPQKVDSCAPEWFITITSQSITKVKPLFTTFIISYN